MIAHHVGFCGIYEEPCRIYFILADTVSLAKDKSRNTPKICRKNTEYYGLLRVLMTLSNAAG